MNTPPPASLEVAVSWLEGLIPPDRRYSLRTARTLAGLLPQVVSAVGLLVSFFRLESDVYEPTQRTYRLGFPFAERSCLQVVRNLVPPFAVPLRIGQF